MTSLFICRSYFGTSVLRHSQVVLPKKKVRSPTALLQALSNTVEWDSTAGAPHHYIDDPHTIPKTRNEKREFTLSKASGRLSARWFMQTYPWFFESVESVPKVKEITAPRYAETPLEGSDPIILGKKKNYEQRRIERRQLTNLWDNVKLLIEEKRAEDAYDMWQALVKEEAIGEDKRQLTVDLFSLLAFVNLGPKFSTKADSKPLEHRFYGSSYDSGVSNAPGNIRWHKDGPASKVFAVLEANKWAGRDEHCTMVRALLRFNEREKALELYTNKVKPNADVATFSELIVAAGQTGPASAEPRLQIVTELLKDFQQAGQAPSLDVFRSALLATAFCARNRFGQEFAMKVLAEMAQCNLNPAGSPALCAALMEIFYPSQNSSPNGFLPVFLSFLEDTFKKSSPSNQVDHPRDRDLAPDLMLKTCDIFRDAEMAVRIHRLLSTNRPNLLMFADVNKETAYYSALLSTLANGDTVERLMEIYAEIIPSRWLPSPNILGQIVDAVELERRFDLIPMLWQDAVKMRLAYGSQALNERFCCAIEKAGSLVTDESLLTSIASVALNMLDHAEYTDVARLNRGVHLTPVALSGMLKLAENVKLPPNVAIDLSVKVSELSQRLRLSSSMVLYQQRGHHDENPKNSREMFAYISELAEKNDVGLPQTFEKWMLDEKADGAKASRGRARNTRRQ